MSEQQNQNNDYAKMSDNTHQNQQSQPQQQQQQQQQQFEYPLEQQQQNPQHAPQNNQGPQYQQYPQQPPQQYPQQPQQPHQQPQNYQYQPVMGQPMGQPMILPTQLNSAKTQTMFRCLHCNSQTFSVVRHQAGNGTYLCCFMLCCISGVLAFVPFFVDNCQDTTSYCPVCGMQVGFTPYKPCG